MPGFARASSPCLHPPTLMFPSARPIGGTLESYWYASASGGGPYREAHESGELHRTAPAYGNHCHRPRKRAECGELVRMAKNVHMCTFRGKAVFSRSGEGFATGSWAACTQRIITEGDRKQLTRSGSIGSIPFRKKPQRGVHHLCHRERMRGIVAFTTKVQKNHHGRRCAYPRFSG